MFFGVERWEGRGGGLDWAIETGLFMIIKSHECRKYSFIGLGDFVCFFFRKKSRNLFRLNFDFFAV